MAKIHINNPKQVINGGAKKYYFKVKGLGGPKGDKGDKGDTGATGPEGPQGNAATVSIGSTTTLPVGYDATVTNSGSIYNAVLNFGIPQGPRGPQGATGAKGDKGDKGDQGNPGPQGEKGTNATVYVGTTSTLDPGSQATVYNSGTDSNAVLNFGIPKGEKGDTGPMPTIAQTTGQAADQVMSQKATTDALNTKQATITSSNKLSADLVDDTSATNKFVTASDITNWNGKQDALTAGTGIDITGGVISTPAIVPEVVTELPTTGAEGKLYLTPKAHTTSTATGNPITATVTAQAGQLESFQLDGDTFQQTYTGKNLLMNKESAQEKTGITITPNSDGSFTLDGTATATTDFYFVGSWQNRTISYLDMPSGDYTISLLDSDKQQIASPKFRVELYDRMGGNSSRILWLQQSYASPQTTTVASFSQVTASYISIPLNQSFTNEKFYIQLELGSTATPFEPYVGKQPSPSPEFPQQIQTVTGAQTISINGTNYPISLGSIELCKLGTYQDYIWKDGEDWKVHKELGKVVINDTYYSTRYGTNSYGLTQFLINLSFVDYFDSDNFTNMLSNSFIKQLTSFSNTQAEGFLPALEPNLHRLRAWIRIKSTTADTEQQFKNWLNTNTPTFYYKLDTATDATITDTTLIAQLDAIRTASLQNGTNTITNTATGTNLAGDMEIGYFEFNPTNRYDKFIWLNLNNNYEQIGGE